MPLNCIFVDLHKAMQVAFRWQDFHLHEFYVYEDNQPIVNIVMNKEAFEFNRGIEMKVETDLLLSDYLFKYNKLKYIYDFGDDWRHTIIVEEIIDDYEFICPTCIAGEGDTPHEGSGGEPGFDYYMECINDETHEEMVR